MKGHRFEKQFLRSLFILNVGLLIPILFRRPPIKDWLLVYLFNASTNSIIDYFLTLHNIVTYPVRFLGKTTKIHVLFDLLLYPTFTVLYNQMTEKDKPLSIFYKLVALVIPLFFIEFWAVRRTDLIKWKKGWNWYHTFSGIILKSLVTRSLIAIIRKIEKHQAQ
ncbi:CBO0543 family protein [Priestia megaterium]|uniref:CBO0543 family protein n=1 Tax=Priestia megaterium TaxID=1404 RepID=UPI003F7F8806